MEIIYVQESFKTDKIIKWWRFYQNPWNLQLRLQMLLHQWINFY